VIKGRNAWVAVGIVLLAGLLLDACAKRLPEQGSGLQDGLRAPAPPASVEVPKPAVAAPGRPGSVPASAAATAPMTPGGHGAAAAGGPAGRGEVARRLVRTVDLELTVRHTTEAAQELERLAARLGGYVASVDGQRQEELMRWSLSLRVPPERLDEALAAAKAMAVRVDREQQKVEDVTDQYVDLDARLPTLTATEAELRGLLAESRQRQRKVEDIMAVYTDLTEIRSQIERIQGQLLALQKLIAFSTLNIDLNPVASARPLAAEGWQPGDTARASARTLIGILHALGDFVIFAAIVLLPVGLILVFAVWLIRRLWRRLRRGSLPPRHVEE
jgi:Domain of unknown function (DUF4349)